MATYVLVHGGGHGGWCWQPVARLLRAKGHEVYAPTLTGLADKAHLLTPDVGIDTHITDVARLIEFEDLQGVILAGHSYGGVVITGTADRASNRIGHLVFLDAAIPSSGESLASVTPALERLAANNRTVDGVELSLWPEDEMTQAIYGLGDCALAEWARARLTPHPWRTFTEPLILSNADAVAKIPRTIVNCPGTLRARSVELLDRYFAAERVWEIDTGHDLMLTEPEATAEMLLRLA
jgi:pimeloyl-ACP methyl ester carboxylesterase